MESHFGPLTVLMTSRSRLYVRSVIRISLLKKYALSVGHFFLAYASPFLSNVPLLPLVWVAPMDVGDDAIVLLLIIFC